MNRLEAWRWRWARLRTMDLAEIPHRAAEIARNVADRRGRAERLAEALPDPGLPAWPIDEARLAALATTPAGDALRADAAAILADDGLTWLGVRRPAGTRCRFDLDPDSGLDWPRTFSHDVYRRHEAAGSEIKLALEHARLPHLQILAAAARWGDREAADAVAADLRAWLGAVRPFRGVSFVTGIETALRLLGLCVVVGLMGERLPGDLRGPLGRSLAAHAWWIARYPSLHSSANNHRIAELAALFAYGTLVAGWAEARAWAEAARSDLEAEAGRQILDDGVGAEMSPSYQAFTMECLGTAAALARITGRPLGVDARLAAGARHLRALIDDGGHHPRIGDDDEGVVIRARLDAAHAVRDVAGAVAALVGAADAVPPGADADLRTALWGVDALAPSPAPASRTFARGGLTTIRPGGPRAPLVVIDHGPLGFGATAAHGHADALSVWLHLDGRPVLVDAGTFRYNGADAFRAWARGTPAHNTVSVDGGDQAVQAGRFLWGSRGRVTVLEADPERGVVEASYESAGVEHRRRVVASPDGVVVVDALSGHGVHDLSWTWQFAPDLDVVREPDGWTVRRAGHPVLRVGWDREVVAETFRQADAPGWGWIAPRFGTRVAATALVVRLRGTLPAALETRLRFAPRPSQMWSPRPREDRGDPQPGGGRVRADPRGLRSRIVLTFQELSTTAQPRSPAGVLKAGRCA